MAPFCSIAGLIGILLASSCNAFLVPGPAQRISHHNHGNVFGLDDKGSTSRVLSGAAPYGGSSLLSRNVDITSPFAPGCAVSLLDSRRQSVLALKAISSAGSGEEGDGRDLSGLRRTVLLVVWVSIVAYAFGPWSPGVSGDPRDIELVTQLYESPGPETAIYYSIFNGLGVLPAVFASVLCGGGSFGKGRQPVPPQPFVFAAFALGYFALGPYLAVRNYLPKIDDGEEASLLEKILTNKLIALPLLGGAAYCFVTFLGSLADPAAIAGFSELFWSSKLVHVSTLDALVLSTAIVDPIREDMRRRGWEPEPAKVALFSVPLVGPALWLLVRPAVVRE